MKMTQLSDSAKQKVQDELSQILGTVLLPTQKRYFLDQSRYLIWEKSRRVGVTWVSALRSVVRRMTRTKPLDHLFSSADLLAAQEWLGYCRFWSDIFNTLLGEEVIPLNDWTSEVGRFANGSRLLILSSSARSFRSKQGDVTLDEYAYHEQQDEIYKAAQPCIMRLPEAYMELISSHNGPESQFNQICRAAERGENRFTWYRHTLEDAVGEGLALKVWKSRIPEFESPEALNRAFIDDVKSGCATPEDYEQEYNCQPAKFSSLISPYDYQRCVLGQVPDELNPDVRYGELYVGIDCGRAHDLTVVWVIERGFDEKALPQFQDVYRTVCVKALRNLRFPEQEAMIRPIVTHGNIGKGYIDQGVVGRGFAEAMQDEMGSVMEPYAITAPRKAAMYERVRQFVQMQRVSLPDDPACRADLLCVRRTQTKAGHISYEGNTPTSHGDYYCALALALEAANQSNKVSMNQIPAFEHQPETLPLLTA
jgi:phage FluMu gp28-like protein